MGYDISIYCKNRENISTSLRRGYHFIESSLSILNKDVSKYFRDNDTYYVELSYKEFKTLINEIKFIIDNPKKAKEEKHKGWSSIITNIVDYHSYLLDKENRTEGDKIVASWKWVYEGLKDFDSKIKPNDIIVIEDSL